VIAFRQADPRFPFLWESPDQPPARWHGAGEGPAHYLAETPDGAWAELLRHEEIVEPADVETIARSLWAIELPDAPADEPDLPMATLTGGAGTYEACRADARRLRELGADALVAPSAAIRPNTSSGYRTDGGLRPGPARTEHVFVLFGPRPELVGWVACAVGRPRPDLLGRIRPLRG
jgi:RES domain